MTERKHCEICGKFTSEDTATYVYDDNENKTFVCRKCTQTTWQEDLENDFRGSR